MQTNLKIHSPVDFAASSPEAARLMMVDGQIRPNRVTDPILLDQMERTPRELFAAVTHKELAYLEGDCLVSASRTMLAPMIFARMVEALHLTKGDTLIDVGGTTGYGAAIMSALVASVTMLEADEILITSAEQNFQHLGLTTISTRRGAIDRVSTESYTAIFVEGAVAHVPETLTAQLAEGGRLIAIVGGQEGVRPGAVTLITKLHGTLSHAILFEASTSFLPGMAPRTGFTF